MHVLDKNVIFVIRLFQLKQLSTHTICQSMKVLNKNVSLVIKLNCWVCIVSYLFLIIFVVAYSRLILNTEIRVQLLYFTK